MVTRAVEAVDRLQRRWPGTAVPVAVWRKFSDDRAGNLAALIAYYGFLAIFPLLLLFITVLDMTLRNNPGLRQTLLNGALAQYPVVGPLIAGEIHPGALPGTGLPLAASIVFLLLGAKGVASAMRNALCEVWAVPRDRRPGFPLSLLNDIALVLVVGIGLVTTTTLSGLAGGAGHVLTGAGATIGAVAISLVLNVGVFWVAFHLAAARQVRWRDLRIGAAIAALVWQVLQVAGGLVVTHQLRHSSSLYGTFGVTLGLAAWLYLQAEVTLYAAELDIVLVKGLWPRSLRSGDATVEVPQQRVEKEEAETEEKAEKPERVQMAEKAEKDEKARQ